MIDLVLATDMKQHFSLISQFKTTHDCAGKRRLQSQHDAQEPAPPLLSDNDRSTVLQVGRASDSVNVQPVLLDSQCVL
jgi:hypothetical protein